jgi:hypothetical protein
VRFLPAPTGWARCTARERWSARLLIADAVDPSTSSGRSLRHRRPRLWALVSTGLVRAWRGRGAGLAGGCGGAGDPGVVVGGVRGGRPDAEQLSAAAGPAPAPAPAPLKKYRALGIVLVVVARTERPRDAWKTFDPAVAREEARLQSGKASPASRIVEASVDGPGRALRGSTDGCSPVLGATTRPPADTFVEGEL